MIEDIQIRDLGVIQDAELSFSTGFTVLTGETGAGKTMVLTALGLLLGERSDSGSIRAGATQTSVSGSWRLPENHEVLVRAEEAGALVDDGVLLLGRTVSADGKSKAVAGGRHVPVGLLSEIGGQLVVVHGQSDQIRLKSQAAQRDALDQFSGVEQSELLNNYQLAFKAWRDAVGRLADARSGKEKLAIERAELTEALEFLGKLDLKPNEDVELQELAQRLTHTEQLRAAVNLAHDLLHSDDFDNPDAISQIGKARKALESAINYDSSLEPDLEQLREISQQLNEITANLSSYLVSVEGDSRLSLDDIQERRSQISLAMRRFGPTLDEVISYQQQAVARLVQLDSGSESVETLAAQAAEREIEVRELAEALSSNRNAAAKDLAERVSDELVALAMAGSKLKVTVEQTPELSSFGQDSVSFLLESYAGAEARPIAKSASGGELSRIMLAIEVVLSESETAATFIFDEIDAGVGGAAAIEVGKRLAKLAKRAQVIVVTHLAQVAAFADQHLAVVKNQAGSFTASDVKNLSGAERQAELARMLSGLTQSQSALQHAEELLEIAKSP